MSLHRLVAKSTLRANHSYTLICTSTDFDAWRTGHAPVTVEEVVKTLHTNAGNARAVAAGILQDVYDLVAEGKELTDIKGSMQFACVTRADVCGQQPLRPTAKLTCSRFSPLLPGRSCRTFCLTLLRSILPRHLCRDML